ncbi:YkgJ family cysteine cluster protein [Nonlabens agnitus]|uniref:Zinc/iron-chelating domain-containing protein n=1 Tax=Nonlabens agnitus TaxID=870484 RepID=A0A2S9WUL0_9FLAO|nr:YkgJ family cysteine cluster protein [Nonlabens agnitus]PRP67164.1 zinc/iron-chelating domain-containing protein [Nonlabens agnitus]
MISPEDLPSLAAQRKKENVAFFKKLKRKAPKNLDSITQELHDEAFEEIDCLTCANCCKTTGPLFTQNDINRIAKHFKMKPAAFIDTYLRIDEDQDYVLQTVPCPFLGADNYCGIYEVRPKACSEYPHTDRRKLTQIASLTIANTFICPAAFQVVERMKELIKS